MCICVGEQLPRARLDELEAGGGRRGGGSGQEGDGLGVEHVVAHRLLADGRLQHPAAQQQQRA